MSEVTTPSIRDRAVVWTANKVLRLASKEYHQWVTGAIEYGLRSAVRDADEGRDIPPDWRMR